jgi:hypothetical protein
MIALSSVEVEVEVEVVGLFMYETLLSGISGRTTDTPP